MPCNPAIGGLAKSHLVKEIDALGGQMAKSADQTALQVRMLNKSKGPAVWSLRAQIDKARYRELMKKILEEQPYLHIHQARVEKIIVAQGKIKGVETETGMFYPGKTVILTPGTFLNGLIHIGLRHFKAGRAGEMGSYGLSKSLKDLGFKLGRLKTGTSPRVNGKTINFKKAIPQFGDTPPPAFSFSTQNFSLSQLPCYIVWTNQKTHSIIRNNLSVSPLYTGVITGRGPRYCPSIEDKVVRFSDREKHQLFLEPEGRLSQEYYISGLSTSLPEAVQWEIVHSIEGLEEAEILRPGYGIEYDFVFPTQLKPSLETKLIEGLFHAGQINGTSGYEEAAAQGLIAGINAARKLEGKPPLILKRDQAYIGVLIDDLVTKGTEEPYRMFTSRAEYRLSLRQDNADLRLREIGFEIGLVPKEVMEEFWEYKKRVQAELEFLKKINQNGVTLYELLKRPENTYQKLLPDRWISQRVREQVEISIKYEEYIARERRQLKKEQELENYKIPDDFDYTRVKGLSNESREKLITRQPITLAQAARISGVSPADISILEIYLRRNFNLRKL